MGVDLQQDRDAVPGGPLRMESSPCEGAVVRVLLVDPAWDRGKRALLHAVRPVEITAAPGRVRGQRALGLEDLPHGGGGDLS